MRVLIVTDAWHPQVNGVVRTLVRLGETLKKAGVDAEFLGPSGFFTLPLPSYPEIRLALPLPGQVANRIDKAAPDFIHIATEGPLGLAARHVCLRRGLAFTTSYHTRFPEIALARAGVPQRWSYRWLRRFHQAGKGMMVATPSLEDDLARHGFGGIKPWTRGVDTDLFDPVRRRPLDYPGPIFLNVGRVAVEKNLPAFLGLDLPGSKIVVGDGPELGALKKRYPDVHFLGTRTGEDLAALYASADVFVFPSLLDTFGNVLLEALASGCPVAAFPVTGPSDVIGHDGEGGVLSNDLRQAALDALDSSRTAARAKAMTYSWAECARQFLRNLHPAGQTATALRRHGPVISGC